VELRVFTLKACPYCPLAKRIAREVAEALNIGFKEVDMDTPEGRIEGLVHQVMSTPSIALDGEVISRGRVVPRAELEAEVRKRLEK